MKNASVLVLVGPSAKATDLDPILQSAAEQRTHLSFLVLGALPRPPVYGYGMAPYGVPVVSDSWQKEIETARSELTETADAIRNRLDVAGSNGDADTLGCEAAELASIIGRRAATCDVVLISNDLRANEIIFRNAVHGTLFQSPVGVILNPGSSSPVIAPKRVFVAWDTGLPAARAVHAALPLLKEATEVIIGVFDPDASMGQDGENPGSEVARWLSHHGCQVDLQQYPSGGKEIGTCIQRRATEAGADLVVMGAYGHSRMRQAAFGGTTRSMVEQTEMPILLAH
ncbi:universal stress protein [Roseovarius sp. Pro17]|uniref:universal stress protein n=1 Tax=Roseovarius sp. Pro17 TaxID=3108175 RepID=UPI002D76EF6F|nr:universal stress protein [Roseovarius sp. Pro17]